MSRAVGLNKIVDDVLDGIMSAEEDYRKWSDGNWLWNAPEYLLTTYIARQLGNNKECHLEMEKNVLDILREAQVKTWDKDIRTGRCDLAIYYKSNYPRGIIEVKNQLRTEGPCEEDIDRLSQMLVADSKESTLQFGIFAFYASGKAPNKEGESLEDKLNTIHDWLDTKLPKTLGHEWYGITNTEEEDGDWSANCIIITRH